MEKRKIPAVRFKGFEDDWEQRKFSDLYAPLVERNSDLLPYNKTFSVATMTYKTDGNGAADSSLANYKRLRTGDIAFEGHTSKSFRYGRFVLNDVGDGIMSPRFSALRPLTQMPTNFWKYYIHYEPIMRKVLVASTKAGTMMNELVIDEFLKSSVLVPSIEEQTRIGGILKNIDNLITLHQRKLEKLQLVKKTMLEKMFPKNGSKIPEIRFEGFADDWEQRKLGEVIRLNGRIGFRGYTEKDIVSKDDGGVLTFSPTNIVDNKLTTNCKNTYITRFKYDESPEIKIHNGDILFVKTGSTLGKSALVTGLSEDATLNPQVVVMRTNNLNAEFLAAMLVTNTIIMQVNSAKIGGAVPTLTETRIKDFDVSIPVSEAEKEQIGKFFSQLDHLITLHQRKLEKLKSFKKSLLEKLFVQ